MSAALREPKMASQILGDDPKVGSLLQVEVEQALPDLLMVSLKSGGKVFRGCLIDTFARACPVGVPDTTNLGARLNKEFGVTMMDTAVILPKHEPGMGDTATKVEDSALSYRQSYFQNMPLPPARPLLFGKKDKTPEIKPKTMNHGRSRQFKLRPRQLLCSKCQGACPTVKAKTASRNRTDKNSLKKRKADSSDVVARKKPRPDPRVTTNGGSNVSKQHAGATGSRPISTPAKSENKSPKKTSPAIKISYATPGKGQRLIVRIPPRTNNFKQGTASPRVTPKNKNRVLTVPLSPLSPSLVKHNVVKKRPIANGVHKASANSPHDKIRIVKTKGTYSIPDDKIPVRTYSPLPGSPKMVNGSGKMMANVTVKPIPLLNGYRSTGIQQKREGRPSTPNFLPPLDNSDAASDCSSHASRGSRKGGRKGKQNGSINNNNSECEFDSDASSMDPPKTKEESKPNNHKKNVTKSILPGGRTVCVGDIIWGKITGFPWWPGRIVQIIVTRSNEGSITKQEAQITWFASRSISFMPLTKLPPFLGEFKKHYDKKRKGLYKEAISQATKAAEALSSEVRELHTMFETPLLNKT